MKSKISIITVILLILGAYFCLFTVRENEFCIVTRFGKPINSIVKPGLYFKLPDLIDKKYVMDNRLKSFVTQPIQLLLGDKNPLIISSYVIWKIKEPLKYSQAINNENVATQKLGDMITSTIGNVLGSYKMENIINTDQKRVKIREIETKILNSCIAVVDEKYGIEMVDFGINKLNYPSIVADSVYERMRSERDKEAKKYRAEGMEMASKIKEKTDLQVSKILAESKKKADILKGEGDKKAITIYSEGYSKDPEFFKFMKTMDIYNEIIDFNTTLVLTTDSDIFRYLKGINRVNEKK